MMPIRSEDKEFIQTLALFGALLGAFVGVIVVVQLSERAHEQYTQQTEYHQTQAAIVKLSEATVNPGQPLVNQEVLEQVQQQIQPQDAEATKPVNESFWLDIPRWGYLGLCAGGCIGGIIAGFGSLWVTGWLGSIALYALIRLFYKGIRKVAPDCAAAKLGQQSNQDGQLAFQRDDSRVLPTLVKLAFLILLSLGVLGMVVWHLTSG
ncbi:MAG: hypothetical protein ACYTET_06490 [Planctomycetota bacterium]|jgi:hypothetical protein